MTVLPDRLAFLNDPPFAAADRALLAHLSEIWDESDSWILIAAALCSQAAREGHAYLDLSQPTQAHLSLTKSWPSLHAWKERFAASPVVRLETEDRSTPLIYSDGRALYLEKYYQFEQRLAAFLKTRSASKTAKDDATSDAVERAVDRPFFVITGGPGTGKTTLALRYLNTLIDRWNAPLPPRFATVAPTGKAAARLAESIANGVSSLDTTEDRKERLRQIPCLTIHRLLGSLPHRASFRRNAKNPIAYDALVVDESSMVDLPLMLKLFEALPETCQVLLLGDKDQLASVEVGSVLRDLLEASATPDSPLRSCVEWLSKTYRFSEDSSIYRACQYARLGDVDSFAPMLEERLPDFAFHAIPAEAQRIPASALRTALSRHESLAACESVELALKQLTDSIVLTPNRQGPFGSVEFNRSVERQIRGRDNLLPNQAIHARPIIVLENDYELELFNGDLGIVWSDAGGDDFTFFPSPSGGARRFRSAELPRHESAFALTIHKSQGSEFREANILVGPRDSQLITRELLYTAFSRAKEKLEVFANPEVLLEGVTRQASRATRLAELLNRNDTRTSP